MKFLVNDFCEIVQARVVIFGMQVDYDVLYRGIANQLSHAYYTPALKKWGYTGLHLSVCPSVLPSLPSFRPSPFW